LPDWFWIQAALAAERLGVAELVVGDRPAALAAGHVLGHAGRVVDAVGLGAKVPAPRSVMRMLVGSPLRLAHAAKRWGSMCCTKS
jgi:hypothetical protein